MAGLGDMLSIVKPFQGEGFVNWEFRMRHLLEYHNLLHTVDNDPPSDPQALIAWNQQDLSARNLLFQSLGDGVLETVMSLRTAKEMMTVLRNIYKKSGLAIQVQLSSKLINMKFTGNGESLEKFLDKFDNTIIELRHCGRSISEVDSIIYLLAAMPEPYRIVTTAVDTIFCQNPTSVTLDFLKNRLLLEEDRQKKAACEPSTSQACLINEKVKKPPVKCYFCGVTGHKKSNCWKRRDRNRHRSTVREQDEHTIAF